MLKQEKTPMQKRRFWMSILLCCLLMLGFAACNDDDNGNGGSSRPSQPSALLSGEVAGSVVRNAQVSVLDMNGQVVVTGTIDDQGRYEVRLPGDRDGPFLIKAQGVQEQSSLLLITSDGTTTTETVEPFVGPWYSILSNEDALDDEATANISPITTIAVWILRAEAAKSGRLDERLVQDYGRMAEEMSKNAFLAGLTTRNGALAEFDAFTDPALAQNDLSSEDANELVANRAAMTLAKNTLSGAGGLWQAGSAAMATNLALLGLDLSDGEVNGQIEGFDGQTQPNLDALLDEALAGVPGGSAEVLLPAIEARFRAVDGGEIQAWLANMGAELEYEAVNVFGVSDPPAFQMPPMDEDAALVANPPAQMIISLNPAVIEIPAGQGEAPAGASSLVRFVVLDGKGNDVTGSYLERLRASALSNNDQQYLSRDAAPGPAVDMPGYQFQTLPFVGLTADNTVEVTVRVLGTSLQGQTLDDDEPLITFVQPTGARLFTAIESAEVEALGGQARRLTMNLGVTGEPASLAAEMSGRVTLSVDNGWLFVGQPDNMSKVLLGQPFQDGALEFNYQAPVNAPDTTANFRIDLENNENITGLAQE